MLPTETTGDVYDARRTAWGRHSIFCMFVAVMDRWDHSLFNLDTASDPGRDDRWRGVCHGVLAGYGGRENNLAGSGGADEA